MGGEAVDEGAADGKGRASEALRFEGGADGGPAILGGLERFGEAGCDGDVPFQLEVEAGAGDDDKVAPGTGAGDDVELLAFGGVGHGLDLDERGFQAEGVGAVVFMAGGEAEGADDGGEQAHVSGSSALDEEAAGAVGAAGGDGEAGGAGQVAKLREGAGAAAYQDQHQELG